MGRLLFKDNIMFGHSFGVDRNALKQKNGQELIDRQKMQRGVDFGLEIAKKKKWDMAPLGNMATFNQNLFVFDHEEIKQFIDDILTFGKVQWSDPTPEHKVKE